MRVVKGGGSDDISREEKQPFHVSPVKINRNSRILK